MAVMAFHTDSPTADLRIQPPSASAVGQLEKQSAPEGARVPRRRLPGCSTGLFAGLLSPSLSVSEPLEPHSILTAARVKPVAALAAGPVGLSDSDAEPNSAWLPSSLHPAAVPILVTGSPHKQQHAVVMHLAHQSTMQHPQAGWPGPLSGIPACPVCDWSRGASFDDSKMGHIAMGIEGIANRRPACTCGVFEHDPR